MTAHPDTRDIEALESLRVSLRSGHVAHDADGARGIALDRAIRLMTDHAATVEALRAKLARVEALADSFDNGSVHGRRVANRLRAALKDTTP